jgi:c-di-GMP-binding flagellar brake protein YcgR
MDNLPSVEERRQHPRRGSEIHKLLRAAVAFDGGNREELYLYLVDLSAGGMRINLERELPTEGSFHLSFDLEGIRTQAGKALGEFSVEARTAWQKSLPGGTRAAGLQFTQVPETTKQLIDELLDMFSQYSRRMHMRLRESVYVSCREVGAAPTDLWWNAQTRDISTQGLCITLGAGQGVTLLDGQTLEIKLLLEEKVQAVARVMWQDQRDDKIEAGLQFVDLSELDGRLLRRWIGKIYAKSAVL